MSLMVVLILLVCVLILISHYQVKLIEHQSETIEAHFLGSAGALSSLRQPRMGQLIVPSRQAV